MADEKKPRSTKPRNDLTAEYVRSILDYNPETGILIWKVSRPPRGKVGNIAGGRTTNGYITVSFGGARYLAHRIAYLIMTGEWPTDDIDHEDTDKSNLKWSNLRAATKSQNLRNHGPQKNNASGLKGVTPCNFGRRWRARIVVHGKVTRLGSFATPEEAHAAYRKAALELHGEFARFE